MVSKQLPPCTKVARQELSPTLLFQSKAKAGKVTSPPKVKADSPPGIIEQRPKVHGSEGAKQKVVWASAKGKISLVLF